MRWFMTQIDSYATYFRRPQPTALQSLVRSPAQTTYFGLLFSTNTMKAAFLAAVLSLLSGASTDAFVTGGGSVHSAMHSSSSRTGQQCHSWSVLAVQSLLPRHHLIRE